MRELPLEESGVDGELCHPRFVACMLRLGDLLDLDSGRFCPTINATIPQLPRSSEAHRGKHAGIRHLLVCPSRIEVSGVYTDLDAYLEAELWFTWLREELSAQLVRWAEIAPPHFGTLPSAGRIEAHLEGQITIESAARPRFEVDREKMIELVQGANIYGGPEDAAREIIQNAIDATLLRYSYEAQSRGASPPKDLAELRTELQAYPILVTFERASATTEEPDKVEWVLSVKDQGIGIRIEDARFLLTLGSSKRNQFRRVLKEWLPEWARPSGTFGIGFHSLFLYCHQVHVLSRHPDDPDGLDITFTTEPEATEPTVIIRRRGRLGKEIAFPSQVGTLVEARMWIDRHPGLDMGNFRRYEREIEALAKYDFVLDQEFPLAPIAISDLIEGMAAGSLCSFDVTLPALSGRKGKRPRPGEEVLRHFSAEDCIEVHVTAFGLHTAGIAPKYRGAAIRGHLETAPLGGVCDLHASDAAIMLDLSRNDFTEKGWRTVSERLRNALKNAVPLWLERPRNPASEAHSGYVSLYGLINNIDGCGDEWRSVTVSGPGSVDLGTIASAEVVIFENHSSGYVGTRAKVENDVPLIRSVGSSSWLIKLLTLFFPSRRLELVVDSSGTTDSYRQYRLAKRPAGEDVSDDALSALLSTARKYLKGRLAFPCPQRFAGLSLNRTLFQSLPAYHGDPDALIQAVLISPFLFTKETNTTFSVEVPKIATYARWLAKQRSESGASVAEKLLEFIRYVDRLKQDEWRASKNYDINLIERELSQLILPPD